MFDFFFRLLFFLCLIYVLDETYVFGGPYLLYLVLFFFNLFSFLLLSLLYSMKPILSILYFYFFDLFFLLSLLFFNIPSFSCFRFLNSFNCLKFFNFFSLFFFSHLCYNNNQYDFRIREILFYERASVFPVAAI